MKHEVRTFAIRNGKIGHEIYRESFETADEAYEAYKKMIADYSKLPEGIRKPIMIVRYNDGVPMTVKEF